jgi:hypothetical protein
MFDTHTFIQMIVDKLIAVNCSDVSPFQFFDIEVDTAFHLRPLLHVRLKRRFFLKDLKFRINFAFALSFSLDAYFSSHPC